MPSHLESPLKASPSMSKPPRPAQLTADYIFYIKLSDLNNIICTSQDILPHSDKWRKIIPKLPIRPLVMDIVSLTWTEFQTTILRHVADDSNSVYQLVLSLHDAKKIKWVASITNPAGDLVTAQIFGAADFANFAESAYKTSPGRGRMDLSLIMANPSEDVQVQDQDQGAEKAIDARKRSLHYSFESPDAKRNTGPADRSSRPVFPVRYESELDKEVEVLNPQTGRSVQGHKPSPTVQRPLTPVQRPPTPSTMQPPACLELERYDMETFLHYAHIDPNDKYTQGRLWAHGIVHWLFFSQLK
ncbi:hypothetical protein PTTG_12769 [Puccinia triticina 1-1 BBBD Race 1]|uniref:Uncharacterized protein n=1 Tax=Puccinia triticina (isolate 1-1 / race 1 (BBBD)) TaxID=630390 RepID=A0A180G2V7_PUCT1|nr:hypothetical protein PTTG_12769 [Puccinia triticina 1-1 BBBD Race 1]